MKITDPTTMSAILSALSATGLALSVWAFKRWISQVDKKLEILAQIVADLQTGRAIAQERQAATMGGIELLRASIESSNETTGLLRASVDKIWTILQIKGITQAQHSDQKS